MELKTYILLLSTPGLLLGERPRESAVRPTKCHMESHFH